MNVPLELKKQMLCDAKDMITEELNTTSNDKLRVLYNPEKLQEYAHSWIDLLKDEYLLRVRNAIPEALRTAFVEENIKVNYECFKKEIFIYIHEYYIKIRNMIALFPRNQSELENEQGTQALAPNQKYTLYTNDKKPYIIKTDALGNIPETAIRAG